jgi:DNA mismatch repair protein MutS2
MDRHAAIVLEFEAVREALRRHCGSELSQRLADALAPSTDAARLRRSLAQADQARRLVDLAETPPFRGLRDHVGRIDDARLKSRPFEPEELWALADFLAGAAYLQEWFAARANDAPDLAALAQKTLDHRPLRDKLEKCVAAPGEVRDEASPRLAELRRKIARLEIDLRALMDEVVQSPRYRPHLMEKTWSLRNGRCVLAVKLEQRGHVGGVVHDKSAGGATVFVEPREAIGPANALAEARIDEERETARILLELTREVLLDAERIATTQSAVAWLDYTFARARYSREIDGMAPRFAEGTALRLRRARHPVLAERARAGTLGRPVEPLTIELGRDYRLLVITGPNTGGKTVVLKTLGLLQLMFQAGLHIPAADGTELPVFDDVFADIGDEQSLSQSLSTFSAHVRHVGAVLRAAGPRTLVLLDELGAGTDPVEGAALGQAVLEKLRAAEALGVVTTHLGQLKTYAFQHPEVENACVDFDPETLEPTYRLSVGRPGNSNALVIARRYGMPEDVVVAAEGFAAPRRDGTHELIDRLRDARVAADEARRTAEDMLAEARRSLDEASRRLKEAEAEKGRLEAEADASLRRQFAELEAAARPHLNALKNVPKALGPDVERVEALLREKSRLPSLADRRRELLAGLKKDDQVYVPKFGQMARVKKMNRAEERLQVVLGLLTMDIGFDDVSFVTPPPSTERR